MIAIFDIGMFQHWSLNRIKPWPDLIKRVGIETRKIVQSISIASVSETNCLCINLQLLTHFWLHKLVLLIKLATTLFCTVLFLIKLSTMKHFVFSQRPCPCRQTFKKIPPENKSANKFLLCFTWFAWIFHISFVQVDAQNISNILPC